MRVMRVFSMEHLGPTGHELGVLSTGPAGGVEGWTDN